MDLLQNSLRPKKLSEVIGQKHLIGEGKILTNLLKNQKLFNIILYGKPGIGKTTIALALAEEIDIKYRLLNATINSKKDFEIVFEEAKMYGKIILIIDEIHRMNKDKQDLLLSYMESNLIVVIGLTSSNPYHVINPAIRSRCQLLELKSLTKEDILEGISRVKKEFKDLKLTKEVKNYISSISNGDLRFAYNLIEFCYYSFGSSFSVKQIEEVNNKANIFGDKNEDEHYDLLSAFQKSIRGSDVDASLHYLSRLIESGDFDSIYRRLSVIVYEDIGLSNPMMGVKVDACIHACERLGMPEAVIPLSNIVIELALSPKSNSAYLALDQAINVIRKGNYGRVPNTIKTNSNIYKYPHNYPNYYVEQQYLPDNIKTDVYYKPKKNKHEIELYNFNKKIKENK